MSWVEFALYVWTTYMFLFALALGWAMMKRDEALTNQIANRNLSPQVIEVVEVVAEPDPEPLQELPPPFGNWLAVAEETNLKNEDKLLLALALTGAEYFIRRRL